MEAALLEQSSAALLAGMTDDLQTVVTLDHDQTPSRTLESN